MQISPDAQAIMLLTVHLGKESKPDARPLSNMEWGRLARWLHSAGLVPSALLTPNVDSVLSGWADPMVTTQRIQNLLNRGGLLGLSVERWERAGLWILTRMDEDYPERLKARLQTDSPPVLFGCGNAALLGQGGLAVIGSRDADEADLAFTTRLGHDAADQSLAIISGGARGVDETAMQSALQQSGEAVGVLADGLLRASTSAKYRSGIWEQRLTLVSPFNPEAGFNVGNAMARNKYIYGLADAAVVVSCTAGKGGTWQGAIENLERHWVPLWVHHQRRDHSGNERLANRGARWLPDDLRSLRGLTENPPREVVCTPTLFEILPESGGAVVQEPADINYGPTAHVPEPTRINPESEYGETAETKSLPVPLYEVFLQNLAVLAAAPVRPEELLSQLELQKSQLDAWLRKAVSERRARRVGRPLHYQWLPARGE